MTPAASRPRVGIVGIPPFAVISRLKEEQTQIFDLDEPIVQTDIEAASPYLPSVYCAILRTVVINAAALDLDDIYIDIGPGKCDCALHTATILEHALPRTRIIRTKNEDRIDFGTPRCRTRMNPVEKMAAITASVTSTAPHQPYPACVPTAGFWGVPPRDFSLLSPFPESTHFYGWSRCMENKTPDNLDLEQHCNPHIPTVFFAQSFCAKTALARHLAASHPHALYVDCDVSVSSSVKAKIQAFLELSGVFDAAG